MNLTDKGNITYLTTTINFIDNTSYIVAPDNITCYFNIFDSRIIFDNICDWCYSIKSRHVNVDIFKQEILNSTTFDVTKQWSRNVMDGKFITFCTFQCSLEGIGYIRLASWLHVTCIHTATKLKGTSRILLHSFYKITEIVINITFMSFWLSKVMDIFLCKLILCITLD